MRELLQAGVDRLGGAARFLPLAVLVAWITCLVGWAGLLLLPDRYESSTRVFVDTRTALSPVIQGLAIQDDVSAYLSLAREAMVGEARLAQILQQVGLLTPTAGAHERARAVADLREAIRIDVEAPGDRGQPGGAIYTISYRDSDRARSLAIVRLLLDGFIEGTRGGKREGSATARSFLTAQIADNERRLRAAEERLAEFKKRNLEVMPGAEGDYFTRLQAELDAIAKARTALSLAVTRRDEIARQRRGEVPFTFAGAPATPATNARPGAPADTQSMLAEAQRRLAGLLLRYTERHPAVAAAREEIAGLERQRERELVALREGDPDALLATGASANPVYQTLQLALNEANVRVAELRSEIAQRERKIVELRGLMTSVPEVEAEFARLNRDYEVTRAQYAALVDRLKKAQLGQDAEATGPVRFDVVDPPTAGFEPVAPRRPQLAVAVLAGAVLLAAAVVFLLNRTRPVFSEAREIVAATGAPLLGEIAVLDLETHRASDWRRLQVVLGGAAGLLLGLGAMLGVVLAQPFG